jgi:hypothetical protein
VTIHGWHERDRGILAPAVVCSMCGRRAYSRRISFAAWALAESGGVEAVYRCDGCGEPENNCYCPDARVSA